MENWEGGTYTAKVPKGTAIAGSGLPRPQKIGSQSPRCHACDWSLRRPFHLKIILGQIDTDFDKLLLPLCGTPATTPWHYDAVEERPSTSSSPSRPRRRTHRLRRIGFVARLGSQAHRSGASHQRAGRRRRRGAARLGNPRDLRTRRGHSTLPDTQGAQHLGPPAEIDARPGETRIRQAWEMDDAGKAETLLRNLARRLEKDWEGVSASILEGLDECSP